MAEGTPQVGTCSHPDTVFVRKRNAGGEPCGRVAEGNRVVERPERVDAGVKTGFDEPPADVVGKTTAEDGDPVRVRDGDGTRAGVNRCL